MSDHHVHRPAAEFYWAILPTPASGFRRATRLRRLGYQLEELMPSSIDQVQVAWTPLPRRRMLACAIELERLRAAAVPGSMRLSPATVPTHLGVSVEAARINLLTGAMTPRAVLSLRRRTKVAGTVAALFVTALALVGMQRRLDHARSQADILRASAAGLAAQIVPAPAGSSVPDFVRLTAELRSLRGTRTDGPPAWTSDAAADLAALLAAWPSNLQARAESLQISPTSITLTAILLSHGDAQRLAESLSVVAGWNLEQPQITALKDAIRATLRLTRTARDSA